MDIDEITLLNLLNGWFTCYWCGAFFDKDHIAEHVNKFLEQVNWLREHVT